MVSAPFEGEGPKALPPISGKSAAQAAEPHRRRYLSLLRLGSGGMGYVDLAVRADDATQQRYALKRLHPHLRDEQAMRTMLLDEARIAAKLRHPNAVSVVDAGEDAEGPYLAMDYVEGVSLSALLDHVIRDGLLPPPELAVSVCEQIALGLHAAHELTGSDGRGLGLVHRDVSPQNVLIGFDGSVRLTDFGIAKARDRLTRTATGVLKGKLAYASPEQLRYEPLDLRSDLFSLGVILYELLGAERLYAQDGDGAATRRILSEPPPDIGALRQDLPPSLVDLSLKLLAKEREQRPHSALAVAARLRSVLQELSHAESDPFMREYIDEVFAQHREAHRERVHAALAQARDGSRADPPPATASRVRVRSRALWASLLAAALGLGLAAFTRLGRERPADLPAARTPRVAAVAPVAPVALGGAAPEASADRQIVVELRSQPTHAAVYVDDRLRGQTPLELRLPRASAPLALRLQLAGYVRLERQLIPDRDQLLELVLAQQPRARTRRAPAAERRRAFRPFE